jgi:hypothetical protein
MVEDVQVTVVKEGAKKWVGHRSDGRTIEFEETASTDVYIELRQVQTKGLMRLHADRIHLSNDGEAWKPWYKGAWADPPATETTDEKEMSPPLSDPDQTPPLPEGVDVETNTSEKPDNCIRLAYFVPRDRQPARDYQARISVVMSVVADVYKLDLKARNHKTAGLTFETRDGKPVVHLVRGSEPARHYNNSPKFDTQEQWRRVLPEVAKAVGSPNRRVIVVFNETYEDAPEKSAWAGTIALGARYSTNGGAGMFSATMLQDGFCATNVKEQYRLIFDQTPVPGRVLKGEPGAKSVRGEFVENSIGAVAHELGHALGLPHDHRDDWSDIMGNGFRKLRLNFTPNGPAKRVVGFSDENARLLMSSRYVATDLDWTDDKPPTVELAFDARRRPLKLTVRAADETGLRSITYFDRIKGTVVAGSAIKGTNQSLELSVPPSAVHDGVCEIEAFVTDNGGNLTRTRRKFNLAAEAAGR